MNIDISAGNKFEPNSANNGRNTECRIEYRIANPFFFTYTKQEKRKEA